MVAKNAICGPSMPVCANDLPRATMFSHRYAPTKVRTTTCRVTQTTQEQPVIASRRALLAQVATLSVLTISSGVCPVPSRAEGVASSSINIDPSNFDFPVIELPKDFVDLAYDLIDALRDAIETDLSGAPEREVRRKAEPAKDLVKRFINTWSSSSAIAETTACSEIRAAVQELGEFYRTKGQRAGMTKDVANSILEHLSEAEKALPERAEKKSFLGL